MVGTGRGRRRTYAGVVLALVGLMSGGVAGPADAAPRRQAVPAYSTRLLPLDAAALNDRGLVVGSVERDGVTRAATWRNGRLRLLRVPAGATSSEAVDVNDRGMIVGNVVRDGGRHAVAWVHGKPRWLREPEPLFPEDGPVESVVSALNDRGDVVGSTFDPVLGWYAAGWPAVSGPRGGRTLVQEGGKANPLEVNDRGVVVGIGASGTSAERWSMFGARVHPLLTLNPQVINGWATSINDAGQVVGGEYDEVDEDGEQFVHKALLWGPRGAPRELAQPRAEGFAFPSQINDLGLIVGAWTPEGGTSELVVWTRGTPRLIGVPGTPVDLDDRGVILAEAGSQSVLVTPRRTTPSASRAAVLRVLAASLASARKPARGRWWVEPRRHR